MKNILLFLAISSTIFFTSCEGDQGPPGEPGTNILGQVFEVTVNFNSSNNFENLISYPSNVEVFESDAVLVYLYDGSVSGNGNPIDIWRPLPQTYFPAQGTLVYNFNHTFIDVDLFLDANFNLDTFNDPAYLNNQTFRIAIVPAEFAATNPTMDQLLGKMQMDSSEIEKIQ